MKRPKPLPTIDVNNAIWFGLLLARYLDGPSYSSLIPKTYLRWGLGFGSKCIRSWMVKIR